MSKYEWEDVGGGWWILEGGDSYHKCAHVMPDKDGTYRVTGHGVYDEYDFDEHELGEGLTLDEAKARAEEWMG